MNSTEILLAVISIFAGKEFWSHMKHRTENKHKDEEIKTLKKKLRAAESSNTRLKKLLK